MKTEKSYVYKSENKNVKKAEIPKIPKKNTYRMKILKENLNEKVIGNIKTELENAETFFRDCMGCSPGEVRRYFSVTKECIDGKEYLIISMSMWGME